LEGERSADHRHGLAPYILRHRLQADAGHTETAIDILAGQGLAIRSTLIRPGERGRTPSGWDVKPRTESETHITALGQRFLRACEAPIAKQATHRSPVMAETDRGKS
jgi:hypothetical protein